MNPEWLDRLVDLALCLRQEATGDMSYGVCFVEDPRDFSPDPECSTEAERAAHAADCERYARGEKRQTETRCAMQDLGGGAVALVTPCGYGLGVNTVPGNPEAADMAEQLEQIVAQASAWLAERADALALEHET